MSNTMNSVVDDLDNYQLRLSRGFALTERVLSQAAYTKSGGLDRTKLSLLHRSGNIGYYK